MNITSAQYIQDDGVNTTIKATIDDKTMFIPIGSTGQRYTEIMRQVEAGELTIEDADAYED